MMPHKVARWLLWLPAVHRVNIYRIRKCHFVFVQMVDLSYYNRCQLHFYFQVHNSPLSDIGTRTSRLS